MRSLGRPFCPVCSEEMVKQVSSLNSVIDVATPADDTVQCDGSGNPAHFVLGLITPAPNSLEVSWYVDSVLQASHDDSLLFLPSESSGGVHRVEAVVVDTTDLVRHDTLGLLKTTKRWYVKCLANSAADRAVAVPPGFSLAQNYPNPFNPGTNIGYTVGAVSSQRAADSWVRLVVYDLLGREVAVLVDGKKQPGSYEVQFDGSGLSSGVYFYRLQAGDFVQTRRLLLLK